MSCPWKYSQLMFFKCRTIYGKKAYVKFESTDKARDLATKIGML